MKAYSFIRERIFHASYNTEINMPPTAPKRNFLIFLLLLFIFIFLKKEGDERCSCKTSASTNKIRTNEELDATNSPLCHILPIPSLQYENTRRQIDLTLREMWQLINNNDEVDMDAVKDVYRLLRSQLSVLRSSDGYEPFRKQENEELSEIVQKKIEDLQNPSDCRIARAKCNLESICGFACGVNSIAYCLAATYSMGETVILKDANWKYNSEGWDKVFQPISGNCSLKHVQEELGTKLTLVNWKNMDTVPPHPFLPLAIPSDIGTRLEKVHGEPYVWWVAQFKKYILRPQPHIKAFLDDEKKGSKIQHPVVGIHIRRTNKIPREAKFHPVEEYMEHAEEWFAIKDMEQPLGSPPLPRRVFIASDDPSAIEEAKQNYTKYKGYDWEVLGDIESARSAQPEIRGENLNFVLRDVAFLAETDYLVCTFSSSICRLAYELMQLKHADASWRYRSLDDVYYFINGNNLKSQVIMEHTARKNESEIELKTGDVINVHGNHFNGLSKGLNLRTNEVGLYPTYKTRYIQEKFSYPDKRWKLDSFSR